MGKFVDPQAFLIAETTVVGDGMKYVLKSLGVNDWASDTVNDHELLTEFAGKSCYMSFDKSLNQNLTRTGGRNNHDYIQQGIIKQKHGSVLEHSTVTFFLTNVSRVVTHELVRHRAGVAVSQTSGRYVRTDEIDMYLPQILRGSPEAVDVFRQAQSQMEQNIAKLSSLFGIDGQSFDLKKKLTSAFRRLAGNGQANHIVVTANHRAWRHIIEMRSSRHAEEEIRVVVADIANQLKARYPAIYADMNSEVVDGIEEWTFEYSKV
jgi:thymidylate synthase (FAD)